MSGYTRVRVEGGTYFFTGVTFLRQPFLTSSQSRDALRRAIVTARKNHSFQIDAWVLRAKRAHRNANG